MAIRQDPSEQKFWTIWQLSPLMPGYFRQLFKYTNSLLNSLQHPELAQELQKRLRIIEQRMGRPIAYIYWAYENLPALNSFTRSNNPELADIYIYKHTMKTWFEQVEDWVFTTLSQLEPEIRFTQLKPMT